MGQGRGQGPNVTRVVRLLPVLGGKKESGRDQSCWVGTFDRCVSILNFSIDKVSLHPLLLCKYLEVVPLSTAGGHVTLLGQTVVNTNLTCLTEFEFFNKLFYVNIDSKPNLLSYQTFLWLL